VSVARVQASKKNEVMISDRPNWNHDNKYQRQLIRSNKKDNSTIFSSNRFNSSLSSSNNNTSNFSSINCNTSKFSLPIMDKSTKTSKSKAIVGLCAIDGKVTQFLADTGATTSVLPEHLSATTNFRQFKSRAVTASGEEMNISGIRDCNIQLGNSSIKTSVLVSPEAQDELLLGMDYLSKCEVTKPHIDGLRAAIKEASKQYEENILNNELPFKEVENINNIMTSEELNEVEEDYVLVQSAVEIEEIKNLELMQNIEAALMEIEAKGVADLTKTDLVEHEIKLIPGTIPIRQKRRPIPPRYIAQFKKSITEMEKAGLIEHSKSPWSSPIHIVRKDGGNIRITQDFKKLNGVTIKDAYPIPNIDSMLSQLSKAKIFTKLDLTHGYWQIGLSHRSRKYTAFSSEAGFHQFKVLPMGLTNACATFQRLMDKVLKELIGEICFVYLDDVIIFSEDEDEHLKHVKMVIERLKQAKLKVKLSKCEFAVKKIVYLSHIIENGTVKPNPKKTAHVHGMPRPTTIKKLKGFLGFGSYYRKYIKRFAKIASPLIRATIRATRVEWTNDCEIAFQKLKKILTSNLILQLPDLKKPFRLDADACQYGVGASLEQPCNEDSTKWKPVAFFSKHLSVTQQNYSTSERELLAIILACEHFKQLLYGAKFQVVTDHRPLKDLLTSNNLSPRLARWLSRLEMFDLEITYREGKKHGNADGLSRMAVEDPDEAEDIPETPINKLQVEALEENIEHQDVKEFEEDENISVKEVDLETINIINIQSNEVEVEQTKDANIVWIYNIIKREKYETENRMILKSITTFENKEQESYYKQRNRLRIINKTLYREYMDGNGNVIIQYVVPSHLRDVVLKKAHDSVYGAHQGRDKVIARLQSRCYWPKMNEAVAVHVQSCDVCQRTKSPSQYNKPELQPIKTSQPLELITTDIMGPCETTNEKNKYILIIIDHFTKWMELYPMKTMEADETAKKIAAFTCRHGTPVRILSDQGRNFQSDLMSEVYEVLDIEKSRTTPYNPRCDGLSERGNRTNKDALSKLVNEKMDNWDEFLPFVQFAYNTSVNATTKCTPFEMMYGRKPRLPLDLLMPEVKIDLQLDPENYAQNLKSTLQEAYKWAEINRDSRVDKEKINYDRKSRAAKYQIGDLVLLLDEAKKKGVSNKFRKKWKGPYSVIEVNETGQVVKIKPAKNNGRSINVNISKLKTYYKRLPQRTEVDHEWIEIKEECNEEPIQTTKERNSDQNQERIKRKYTKRADKLPAIQTPVSNKTYSVIKNRRKAKRKELQTIKQSGRYQLRRSQRLINNQH